VEIVSKGSERTDRWLKPVEYAAAGIRRFWRVEPDDTVAQFELDGAAYTQVGETTLDALLAGPVPDFS
jgi:Uma2 family endonuclease